MDQIWKAHLFIDQKQTLELASARSDLGYQGVFVLGKLVFYSPRSLPGHMEQSTII